MSKSKGSTSIQNFELAQLQPTKMAYEGR